MGQNNSKVVINNTLLEKIDEQHNKTIKEIHDNHARVWMFAGIAFVLFLVVVGFALWYRKQRKSRKKQQQSMEEMGKIIKRIDLNVKE